MGPSSGRAHATFFGVDKNYRELAVSEEAVDFGGSQKSKQHSLFDW